MGVTVKVAPRRDPSFACASASNNKLNQSVTKWSKILITPLPSDSMQLRRIVFMKKMDMIWHGKLDETMKHYQKFVN
jgi:hypothetical protein